MKTIRIGTRKSPLAMWQAQQVAKKLSHSGVETEIIAISSHGDQNLKEPLYALGITGVFTKHLDAALLAGQIDVGVHSLKDVPTSLPVGVVISAVLERDYPEDILIRSHAAKEKPLEELTIATSSLRRRAFWLNQFPETNFLDIRGNVQTRIAKIENGLADATLLSLAGVKRMDLDLAYEEVPFLLQAPSQGVVACTSLEENMELNKILHEINHEPTEKCTAIERRFLQKLEGGCTAPIGAKAILKGDKVHFEGRVVNLLGDKRAEIIEDIDWRENLGDYFGEKVLQNGGAEIMEEIKSSL